MIVCIFFLYLIQAANHANRFHEVPQLV